MAEIVAERRESICIECDLKVPEAAGAMVARVVSTWARLDCAFNNAGISRGAPLDAATEENWDDVITSNLKATFFCLKAEAAPMRSQGRGAILFNGSVLAGIAQPGVSAYSASKSGLVSLARAAAVGLGPLGNRVSSVNPSVTRAPLTKARITRGPDHKDTHPLGANIPLTGRQQAAAAAAFGAGLVRQQTGTYLPVFVGVGAGAMGTVAAFIFLISLKIPRQPAQPA